MPPRAPRSVRLSGSDLEARLRPDGYSENGWALDVGGIEQSHVDPSDPTAIRHEYLRRIAHVVDACAEAGTPLHICHLGAGALTLARYVQATRPGSAQIVVEIERELPRFVISALPMPEGTDLEIRIGDAAEVLGRDPQEAFDVLVIDVFSGQATPEHLTHEDFFATALAHLGARGLMAVNVGDDAGLRFYADQASALDAATEAAGLSGVWTLTDARVARGLEEGNLVLVAGPGMRAQGSDLEALRAAWTAGGPHPAVVLDPVETARLVERIRG